MRSQIGPGERKHRLEALNGESMTQTATAYTAPVGTMPTTGRWGWYKDHEGREFQRATSLIKKVETDREGLDKWFRYTVAIGMALREDLVLAVKAIGAPGPDGYTKEQKSDLAAIAEKALEAGKQGRDGGVKGTAVHTLTERVDRGEDVETVCAGLPAAYAVAVRNYVKLLDLNAWRVVEVERTIVNDDLNVAGTLDRIYDIPGLSNLLGTGKCQYGDECPDVGLPGHGDAVIGDVKSEEDPVRNGLHIGPQLAIYSRAKRMWLPGPENVRVIPASGGNTITGRYVPMPCVRQDVAVVVHVDQQTGDVRPLFVDLTKGWRLAVRAREQANDESVARRKLGQADGFFAEMPGIQRPRPAESFVEHAVIKDYANGGSASAEQAWATATGGQPPHPGDHLVMNGSEKVAVTGADGWVHWVDAPTPAVPAAVAEAPVGTVVTVAGQQFTKIDTVENVVNHGALDEVDKSAIEVIWAASDLTALGRVWEIYTQTVGRQWGGRVADAAEARRRQIECPQRALHTGNGKCACGWNGSQGFPA